MKVSMRKIFRKNIVLLGVLSLIIVQIAFAQKKIIDNPDRSEVNKKAIYELLERILPKDVQHFKIDFISSDEGKNVFEIESENGKIILRGNNGISIASALNYYLKNYAHCDISWNGTNLNIPHPLPVVPRKIHKLSPYKYRYYFNYCTFVKGREKVYQKRS